MRCLDAKCGVPGCNGMVAANALRQSWGKTMKTVRNKISGFTLIELLIVVAIIGILASISVPIFRDYTIRGYNSAATADLRYFKTQLEAEFVNQQAYPNF